MRVAVIGSRNASQDVYQKLCEYIPCNASEIVSGGAVGVDALAERYAKEHHIALRIFRPDYKTFGRRAPLLRNEQIVHYAQYVLAFWDGQSRGTAYSVMHCMETGVPVRVIRI